MKNPMTRFIYPISSIITLFVIIIFVSGCTNQKGLLPNYIDDDMRERHLIVQKPIKQSLTIIPIGPKQDQISPADSERIKGFIHQFKLSSQSNLSINYAGSIHARPAVSILVKDIHESQITTHSLPSQSGAVLIIMTYEAIQSVLEKGCEGKATDGGNTLMVPNKTIGCAYTNAFSMQINDPRDLLEPLPSEKKYYTSTNNPNSNKSESEDTNNSTSKLSDSIKSIMN